MTARRRCRHLSWVVIAVLVSVGCGGGPGVRPTSRPLAAAAPDAPAAAPSTRVPPSVPAATTALAPVDSPRRPAPLGAQAPPVSSRSVPVGIDIARLGVRSGLERLARDSHSVLQPPRDFDLAGWYADGPQPGELGPAVIAGHVDSRTGPAVFYRLAELKAGDRVTVRRQDGSVLAFAITRVEQYPKAHFPTASVYGPAPGPELRLITCGGSFDRSAGHYRDNIVAYGLLI